VPESVYANERIARLLRLLRPAPDGWVRRARDIFVVRVADPPDPGASRLRDGEVGTLARALESDPVFRRHFDVDPVGAVEAAEMPALAAALERELHELVSLAERIAADDAYRVELTGDPVKTLADAGIPEDSAESLLRALAAPDYVLANLPEVVAHRYDAPSARARMLVLLLGSASVADRIRAAARLA
jgi:hypothetical protein